MTKTKARGDNRAVLRRCAARNKTGAQCGNGALPGINVCRMHGGAAPQVQKSVQLARMHDGLRKLITPIDASDVESDPLMSFEMEFRRTIGRIRYFDEKIAEFTNERDLVWGITKQEDIEATEYGGTNVTYEAKMNIYYEAQFRERQHLTDLHKIWIGAKLDARKLELERDVMDRLEAVISAVIVGLGRNSGDPEVRLVVRQAMLPVAS